MARNLVGCPWSLRPAGALLAFALTGCFAGTTDSLTPGLQPNLRELPSDSQRRNEYLESTEPEEPENQRQKPLSVNERRAETVAATAASILGILFSTTDNVIMSAGGTFGGSAAVPIRRDDGADESVPPPDEVDASDLVPWVKLPSGSPETKP